MDNTILKNKILSHEGNALIFQANGVLMFEVKDVSTVLLDSEVLKIVDKIGVEYKFKMYNNGKDRLVKDCTMSKETRVIGSVEFTYDDIGDTIVGKEILSTPSIEDNYHM